ncbi:DgyrCDS1241 [Dimorphilus gyrociliatus]|uniref:DgyrCDS1241 n=1 Tax=Dimorphilus gyrociliatus TaxID=2664684 RepID=A0A7I8V6N9_9ANNE|nr:DgyrCDS1241 [Dimorphilus gyrociliatus]
MNSEFKSSKIFKAIKDFNSGTPNLITEYIYDGEDPCLKNEYGDTFLHSLCDVEITEDNLGEVVSCIYRLIYAGCDLNCRDADGNTVVHVAVMNEVHPRITHALLRCGVDPFSIHEESRNVKNIANGRTKKVLKQFHPGIWKAVSKENADKVTELVSYWSNLNIVHDDVSLLELAEQIGNPKIIHILSRSKHSNEFIFAALANDVRRMRELYKHYKPDLNPKDISSIGESDIRERPLLYELVFLGNYEAAKFLIKRGADLCIEVTTPDWTKLPLFAYILHQSENLPSNFLRSVLENIDFSKTSLTTSDILYECWKSNMDPEVASILLEDDRCLAHRDELGYTVRERIFLEIHNQEREIIEKNLQFIDRHICKMAKNGELEKFQGMALDGYEHFSIKHENGKSLMSIAKKYERDGVLKFLMDFPDFWRKSNKLHKAIVSGDIKAVKELSDEDTNFRTALHYAQALKGGENIINELLNRDCDEMEMDINGLKPDHYTTHHFDSFIETEKETKYGLETNLIYTYRLLREAIESDCLQDVQEIIDKQFDFELNEIHVYLDDKGGSTYTNLLELCVEYNRDAIGEFLINNQLDIYVPYRSGAKSEVVPLLSKCKEKSLVAMEVAILKKLGKYNEPKAEPVADTNEESPKKEPKAQTSTSQSRPSSRNSLESGPSDELERLRQTPDSSIKPTINHQPQQKIEEDKNEKTDKEHENEKNCQTPPRSSSCILL